MKSLPRLLVLSFFLSGSLVVCAQSTVFVVRHADRGPEEPDAHPIPEGFRKADELAAVLSDANLRHIYTTDTTRTQQTAAPTAKQTGLTPVVVAQKDFDGLIAAIRSTLRDGEATLAVGHRSTVPKIVKALSGKDISALASGEFTRLVVVTLFPDGRSSVVTLRYGVTP